MVPDLIFGGECMSVSIPFDEQETIINIVPAQCSRYAALYSCMPSMIKRIKKLAQDRPDVVTIVSEDEYSITASVDRSCVKIAPKRKLSDEQRKAATERLANARAKGDGV